MTEVLAFVSVSAYVMLVINMIIHSAKNDAEFQNLRRDIELANERIRILEGRK